MATKVQLIGGAFQDSKGNLLALGYLIMKLSQDGVVSGTGQICSGVEIKITLNSSGAVDTSAAQSVWGNDQMLPANSYYRVFGYNAGGQLAWGPNNQQVNGSGGTFDVGTWTPNTVISWTPSLQPLALKTNGVANGSQTILNLKQGTGITVADDGVGGVTVTNTGGSILPQANIKIWRGWTSRGLNGVGAAPTYGDSYSAYAVSDTGVAATATDPCLNNLKTQGSTDNTPADIYETNPLMNTGIFKLGVWSMKYREIVTQTRWLGFTDAVLGAPGTALNSNTPAANIVGFMWSNTIGNSNWRCVAQTGAGSQTLVDTGVAVDANRHSFTISYSGGVLTYYIDSTQVGTISTNIPATSVNMSQFAYLMNHVAVQQNLDAFMQYWDSGL